MKFHIVVIGRLKSTRLPLKALLPLGDKFSISTFLMTRLKHTFVHNDNVHLSFLTSDLASDDDLAKEVSDIHTVFRGNPLNVLDRIISADCFFDYKSDYILRVTADNPLTCPLHIQLLMDYASKNTDVDYAIVPDLNTGLRAELISLSYLNTVSNSVSNPNSSEYMSFMLDRPDYAKTAYLDPLVDNIHRSYSYTIDTQPQYNFVNSIVKDGFAPESDLSLLFEISQAKKSVILDYKRYSMADRTTTKLYDCCWKKDF